MNYEEYEFKSFLVRLLRIGNLVGWYVKIKENEYGNYMRFEKEEMSKDEVKSSFEMMKKNAEHTINQLLK